MDSVSTSVERPAIEKPAIEEPVAEARVLNSEIEYDKYTLYEEVEEELKRMKGNKEGPLTFAELREQGFTEEELAEYIREEDLKEIKAGPMSRRIMETAKKYDNQLDTTNMCLTGIQRTMAEVSGKSYPSNLPKVNGSNGGGYFYLAAPHYDMVSFRFDNDIRGKNPYLKDICPGAIVSLTPGEETVYGHVTCMGDDKQFHCDSTQQLSTICSGKRRGGDAYGRDIYVSYSSDCTVSDKLLERIIKERKLNEMGIEEKDLPYFRGVASGDSRGLVEMRCIVRPDDLAPVFNNKGGR